MREAAGGRQPAAAKPNSYIPGTYDDVSHRIKLLRLILIGESFFSIISKSLETIGDMYQYINILRRSVYIYS